MYAMEINHHCWRYPRCRCENHHSYCYDHGRNSQVMTWSLKMITDVTTINLLGWCLDCWRCRQMSLVTYFKPWQTLLLKLETSELSILFIWPCVGVVDNQPTSNNGYVKPLLVTHIPGIAGQMGSSAGLSYPNTPQTMFQPQSPDAGSVMSESGVPR